MTALCGSLVYESSSLSSNTPVLSSNLQDIFFILFNPGVYAIIGLAYFILVLLG